MEHKIYTLKDFNGAVRYVGYTSRTLHRRLSLHISSSANSKNKQYNYRVGRWIRKHFREYNCYPTIELLINVPQGEEWQKYEIEAIANFKAQGFNLTNSTTGGDRVILDAEARLKISKANSGKRNGRYGKPVSKETRDKISKANKGNTHTEEERKRISERTKGSKRSLKSINKAVASNVENFPLIKASHPSFETSVEFRNKTAFAKKYNLCNSTIGKVLKGKFRQHKGWTFEYV